MRVSVVADSVFIVVPIVCRGFVLDPCFEMRVLCALSSFLVLQSSSTVGWSVVCDCGISLVYIRNFNDLNKLLEVLQWRSQNAEKLCTSKRDYWIKQ